MVKTLPLLLSCMMAKILTILLVLQSTRKMPDSEDNNRIPETNIEEAFSESNPISKLIENLVAMSTTKEIEDLPTHFAEKATERVTDREPDPEDNNRIPEEVIETASTENNPIAKLIDDLVATTEEMTDLPVFLAEKGTEKVTEKETEKETEKVTDKEPDTEPDQDGDVEDDSKDEDIITEEEIEQAFKESEEIIKKMKELDNNLTEQGRTVKDNETDLTQLRDSKQDPITHEKEDNQLPFEVTSDILSKRHNLTKDEMKKKLPKKFHEDKLMRTRRDTCKGNSTNITKCDPESKYRTADGQCNNLLNTTWGSAMNCQQRMLPAHYSGTKEFRLSQSGEDLPNARTLSLNLHKHLNQPSDTLSHMYTFFAQLLSHDMTQVPISVNSKNMPIECCPNQDETHPQCKPIILPDDDPVYSPVNQTCFNFVRSAICATCEFGAREQMNQITAFIDASFVYGNIDEVTDSLRTKDGSGQMTVDSSEFGDLLPPKKFLDKCDAPKSDDTCFFEAGDSRANQHTALTSLHTIFLRQHNRMAKVLKRVNPKWDEEKLFQETRRILGAIMQVIAYKEYLPLTLGPEKMDYFDLDMGERTEYESDANPTMYSEFTTAAFRYGHSMVNNIVQEHSKDNQVLLRDDYFQPFDLRKKDVGKVLNGAFKTPAQTCDRHVIPDLTNFLHRMKGKDLGMDLAAINLYRGRDHGMPPYVDVVEFCTKKDIKSFEDLTKKKFMAQEQVDLLQKNYKHLKDIELWSGILMETPKEGGVVGETGACIIGIQFHELKFGDRFYVEHKDQKGSFTDEQLKELMKVTLSQILCLNSEVSEMPKNAMLFESKSNPAVKCKDMKGVDLKPWKE